MLPTIDVSVLQSPGLRWYFSGHKSDGAAPFRGDVADAQWLKLMSATAMVHGSVRLTAKLILQALPVLHLPEHSRNL